MIKMKQNKAMKFFIISLLLTAILLIPFTSVLAESLSGDNVIVESDSTLEKTSFLSGQNVRVDGDINGTTFITAGNIEINGTIDGDLFIAGQNTTINGNIKGSIFAAGQDITVNGVVENNIFLAGATLKTTSQTNGGAFLAGQTIFIEDEAVIERDAFVGASKIYQNGIISGDLSSSSDSLSVGGKIGGNLNYSSQKKVALLSGSEIAGKTVWEKIESKTSEYSKSIFTMRVVIRVLLSIIASLIVWLVVKWIRPNFWLDIAGRIGLNPIKTMGFGVLAVVFIPLVSVLLMFTLIGIPLSLIMLSLYGIALYMSKIILSVYIGSQFQKKFNWSNVLTFGMFLLSLVVIIGLGTIPIIGMLIGFVTVSFGTGSIVLAIADYRV